MECGAVYTLTNEPTPEEDVIYYLSIQRKCNGDRRQQLSKKEHRQTGGRRDMTDGYILLFVYLLSQDHK